MGLLIKCHSMKATVQNLTVAYFCELQIKGQEPFPVTVMCDYHTGDIISMIDVQNCKVFMMEASDKLNVENLTNGLSIQVNSGQLDPTSKVSTAYLKKIE